MICRRCGAELPDNAIRCSNCGIKVNMYCPECRTINSFGSKSCKNCGFELLKPCPVCGSLNIYSATECRKCHTSLEKYQPLSKDNLKVGSDFEVVSSFSSQQSSYINNEIIKNPEKFDNDLQTTIEDEIPFVEPLVDELNDDGLEKIFNIEDENVEENDSVDENASDNNENLQRDSSTEQEKDILTENIEVEQLTEEYDSSVEESLNSIEINNQIRLQKMLTFIYENYADSVTLEDISKAANISRSEAGRCFRKYMGCSPIEALISYRLQTAHRLLGEKALSLSEISFACGFNSVNYFSRQFKKVYGYTPRQSCDLGK